MQLTSSIIYEELRRIYDTTKNRTEFLDKPISAPLMYCRTTMDPSYIYLAGSEEVNLFDIQYSSLICLGTPKFKYLEKSFDLIIVNDAVSLAELFNSVQMIFNKYNAWDDSIKEGLNDGKSMQQLLELTGQAFPGLTFTMVNADFVFFASSVPGRASTPQTLDEVNRLKQDPEWIDTMSTDGLQFWRRNNGADCLYYNIKEDGVYVARLLVGFAREQGSAERHFTAAERQLITYFGEFLQKRHMRRGRDVSGEPFGLKAVITKMINDPAYLNSAEIEPALRKNGWHMDDRYMVIQIMHWVKNEVKLTSNYLCSQLRKIYPNSCPVQTEGGIAWCINLENELDDGFFQDLAVLLREGLYKAGISQTSCDFMNLHRMYMQTVTALEINEYNNSTSWISYFDDCKMDYIFLLLQCESEYSMQELSHEGLNRLLEYDRSSGSEYCRTLYVYIRNRFNASKTADELFIHRTTFLFRLKRIEEIAKINFEDVDEMILLLLSFKMMNINGSTSAVTDAAPTANAQ